MRTRRYAALIIAVLGCSMVLTSCDAISSQTISSNGSGSGSRMNGDRVLAATAAQMAGSPG